MEMDHAVASNSGQRAKTFRIVALSINSVGCSLCCVQEGGVQIGDIHPTSTGTVLA
jgi:hypothetical protein